MLLRAVIKDGCLHGRKIATATMSEARIQATVGKIIADLSDSVGYLLILFLDSTVLIEGSLGGLQVLDLTSEGHIHQRIVSVGKDPLIEAENNSRRDILATLNADLYKYNSSYVETKTDERAFSFCVKRSLQDENGKPK